MDPFRLSRTATVAAAIGLGALSAITGLMFAPPAESQTAAGASSAATPRRPDGKPDLTGMWDGRGGGAERVFTQFERLEGDGEVARLFPSRRCAPNQLGCRDNTNQSNDGELTGRVDSNLPLYKPEHWERVQFLDYDTNFSDPMFKCEPLGVPRIGPPRKIVQTANEVIFMYGAVIQTSNSHDYRIIPIDGRGHNPNAFPTYFGDSVGRWEGDTLVIEAVSFTDTTWLGPRGGYFHSFDLKVTERLRREGDILHYDVTVEDPTVLIQPWVLRTRQLRLNPDPKATIAEGLPCKEYDSEITETRIRH